MPAVDMQTKQPRQTSVMCSRPCNTTGNTWQVHAEYIGIIRIPINALGSHSVLSKINCHEAGRVESAVSDDVAPLIVHERHLVLHMIIQVLSNGACYSLHAL